MNPFVMGLTFGPSSGIAAVVGCIVGCIVTYVAVRGSSASKPGGIVRSALDAAFEAHKSDLGFLTPLFRALAANDKSLLSVEVEHLGRLIRDGASFETLLEGFTHAQVRKLLADPLNRAELLDLVSDVVGYDVRKSPEKAPEAAPKLPTALPLLLALAMCLFVGQAAIAADPERFVSTDRTPVIDKPQFYNWAPPRNSAAGSYAPSAPARTLAPPARPPVVYVRPMPPVQQWHPISQPPMHRRPRR